MANAAEPSDIGYLAMVALLANGYRPVRVSVVDSLGRDRYQVWHRADVDGAPLDIRLDWMDWQNIAHGYVDAHTFMAERVAEARRVE